MILINTYISIIIALELSHLQVGHFLSVFDAVWAPGHLQEFIEFLLEGNSFLRKIVTVDLFSECLLLDQVSVFIL